MPAPLKMPLPGVPRNRNGANARDWTVAYLAYFAGVPPGEIDLALTVAAYALDSMDAVVMAAAMEEHFEAEIDPGLFLREASLAEAIAGLCAGPGWRDAGA